MSSRQAGSGGPGQYDELNNAPEPANQPPQRDGGQQSGQQTEAQNPKVEQTTVAEPSREQAQPQQTQRPEPELKNSAAPSTRPLSFTEHADQLEQKFVNPSPRDHEQEQSRRQVQPEHGQQSDNTIDPDGPDGPTRPTGHPRGRGGRDGGLG